MYDILLSSSVQHIITEYPECVRVNSVCGMITVVNTEPFGVIDKDSDIIIRYDILHPDDKVVFVMERIEKTEGYNIDQVRALAEEAVSKYPEFDYDITDGDTYIDVVIANKLYASSEG